MDEILKRQIFDGLKLNSFALQQKIYKELLDSNEGALFQEIPIDFQGGTKIDIVYRLIRPVTDGMLTRSCTFQFCIEVKYSNEPWIIFRPKKIQKVFNTKLGIFLKDDYQIPICDFSKDFPDISSNLFLSKKNGNKMEIKRDEGILGQVLRQQYSYAWALSQSGKCPPQIVIPILLTNAPIISIDINPNAISSLGEILLEEMQDPQEVDDVWIEGDYFISNQEFPSDQRYFVNEIMQKVQRSKHTDYGTIFRPIHDMVKILSLSLGKSPHDLIDIASHEIAKLMPDHIFERLTG